MAVELLPSRGHPKPWRTAFGKAVSRTASFNLASTAASAAAGILIARSLGTDLRGQYAAIATWFFIAQNVGAAGQTAATTFYVARHPEGARDYVATARWIILAIGALTTVTGCVGAQLLGRGNDQLTWGYRAGFCICFVYLATAAYLFSLQASRLLAWNVVRLIQPLLFLILAGALHFGGVLTLESTLLVLGISFAVQATAGYLASRRAGNTGGRLAPSLVRPMVSYGSGQLGTIVSTSLNSKIDQLILSLTVSSSQLGWYAVAVSMSTIAIPITSALGQAAFPKIAARTLSDSSSQRLNRVVIAASLGIGVLVAVPLVIGAPWLVPAMFGAEYRVAVPWVWLLAVGGIFDASAQVVGDLLRGAGRLAHIAVAQSVGALATGGLVLILLPTFGIPGAAVASNLGKAACFVLLIVRMRGRARAEGS